MFACGGYSALDNKDIISAESLRDADGEEKAAFLCLRSGLRSGGKGN